LIIKVMDTAVQNNLKRTFKIGIRPQNRLKASGIRLKIRIKDEEK